MEIYLIRHTPPKVGTGICYGQTDIPLDDNFEIESGKIKLEIPEKFDVIFSSPLTRCKLLAENIFNTLKIPCFEIDDRLIEFNFGKWEMKKWEIIDSSEFKSWEADLVNYQIPEGESLAAMQKRVNGFIDDLLIRKIGKAVIITHAGVIRCFLSKFKNISVMDTFKIPVEFSTIHTLYINQQI